MNTDQLTRLAMIGGGLYVAHEVLGLFTHEDPGGSVTPGGGDTRPATMDAVTARVLADRIAVAFYGDGLVVRPWEYDEDAAAALMVPLVTDASLSATVDNCPVVKLVTGQGADKPLAGIDFPPVFDAEGRPVMWNHELAFNGAGAAIAGVVVQVYWDPDTPKG
jgi:hypothetical protein